MKVFRIEKRLDENTPIGDIPFGVSGDTIEGLNFETNFVEFDEGMPFLVLFEMRREENLKDICENLNIKHYSDMNELNRFLNKHKK